MSFCSLMLCKSFRLIMLAPFARLTALTLSSLCVMLQLIFLLCLVVSVPYASLFRLVSDLDDHSQCCTSALIPWLYRGRRTPLGPLPVATPFLTNVNEGPSPLRRCRPLRNQPFSRLQLQAPLMTASELR
ncbi:hypothetical protein BD414DRAFT_184813 [Trametes punicea]|nr:hypothetical protein BD414DRAFT_184813 [Trametes punicea]